jgi:hypothetical protein
MATTEIDLSDIAIATSAPAPPTLAFAKAAAKIVAYLSAHQHPEKVAQADVATATGLRREHVSRVLTALGKAGRVRVHGTGLEMRSYEILPDGSPAPAPAPPKSRSPIHAAMAKALSAAGCLFAEEIPYRILIPTHDGEHSADIVVHPLLVIECGPLSVPSYRRSDTKKRALCDQHGIRYLRVRAAADVRGVAETIRLDLTSRRDGSRPRPTAEALHRLADATLVAAPAFAAHMERAAARPPPPPLSAVNPDPRAVNDGRDWQHFNATGEIRPYVERDSLGPGAEYRVLPLPDEEIAARALAVAEAEAKAFWGDMLE